MDLVSLLTDWRVLATIFAAVGIYLLMGGKKEENKTTHSSYYSGYSGQKAFSPVEAEAEKAKNLRDFTFEEVATHTSIEKGVWLIINDKVYDVTKFAPEHPGGLPAILAASGKDATMGFFGDQHPDTVREMINRYQIGQIKK